MYKYIVLQETWKEAPVVFSAAIQIARADIKLPAGLLTPEAHPNAGTRRLYYCRTRELEHRVVFKILSYDRAPMATMKHLYA